MSNLPRRRSLRQRVQWEIFERTPASNAAFMLFDAIVFFFPFGIEGKNVVWIRACCVISFLLSAARQQRASACLKKGFATNKDFRTLWILVISNSIFFSGIFAISTWDLLTRHKFSVFEYGIIMGFITGSLVSLSPSRSLFNFFVCVHAAPQIFLFAYGGFVLGYEFDPGILLTFTIILAYLLREGGRLRRRMVELHTSQIRLENTNRRLLRSRQELVEQTSRNVHASRLASLGEMAGGIAHEINNPLAIIHLSLDTFEMHLDDNASALSDPGKEAIRRCQGAVSRISTIIRGLRNFSRMGDQDPLMEVPLEQVITDSLDLCNEKLKAQEVELSVEGIGGARLLCRPVEIAQILVNLINNAKDVVVELPVGQRFVRIRAEEVNGMVFIRVSDSGPPLSKETKAKIFQPFFTTKPVGIGTGLGLSISRSIAKRHNGDLTLDLKSPETTFVLQLPLAGQQ